MKKEKQFASFSSVKGNIELYQSAEVQQNNNSLNGENNFYQILLYGTSILYRQLFIRYPNTDYFVEIFCCGSLSNRGKKVFIKGYKNVWEEKYGQINLYVEDSDLLLIIGELDILQEFQFMKKIETFQVFPVEYSFYEHACPEIQKAMGLKYLKLPENVRIIIYCLKTIGDNPIYFLVDAPFYNVKYENHRFFCIENGITKPYKITNFTRLRDGGTTSITVEDYKGAQRVLHVPSKYSEQKNNITWDENIKLVEAEKQEIDALINLLGIEVINHPDFNSNNPVPLPFVFDLKVSR